ncbi:MAG TPA: hypothetical protein VGM03_04375 [Phycisphaerae bacterium]|jgi:hypothetical protein
MYIKRTLILNLFLSAMAVAQMPLGTAFTYQGRLQGNGNPANGLHDLRFRLYDASVGGAQVGSTVCLDNVSVSNGLFTVLLDFGAQFAGQQRFLEVDVRADTGLDCSNLTGFVILTPRQALTAAPNALFALNADRLDGLDSTAFLQSIPVPLTLSGTSATHIIRGENASTANNSSGVRGACTAATGAGFGLYGTSVSMSGRGVYGAATAASGIIYGVYGFATATASGYGIYANGDFGASGTKSFRIDHPDDPANKYLLHYAAESPEVINFYSGKVTLDAAGEAVVELPRYFAKINKDPRYTLTAMGAPMPMLHVAEEIDEAALSAGAVGGPGGNAPVCRFRIAGGVRGAKVSWRVDAVRNDAWVRTRGAPVETEKQDLERGTYQHPELYGQPPERGLDFQPETERHVARVAPD